MADEGTAVDESTDTTATQAATEQQPPPATDGADALGDAGKQALDRMKAERNAASSRAKALEKELASLKQAQMSEAEKQVAEAEARGRSAAASDFGKRLARTQFDAIAGRRNPDFDTNSALEFVDLGRFVGEDGEPDAKAIKAAVERLVPAPPSGPPSFDGGARKAPPKATNMDDLIRGQVGLGRQ